MTARYFSASRSEYEAARQAAVDALRPSSWERGYDRDWQRLRIAHLAINPLCAQCGAMATDVDHVNTIRSHPELRLAPSNLQSLCKPCHSRKTVAEDGGFGRRRAAGAA